MFEDFIGKQVIYVMLEQGELVQHKDVKMLGASGNFIMVRENKVRAIINASSPSFVKIILID